MRYLPVEDVGHNTGGDGQGEDHKNTQHILEHETTFQVQLTWQGTFLQYEEWTVNQLLIMIIYNSTCINYSKF